MKEEGRRLLEKASHAIHAAEILLNADEIDSAAGRAYYAIFYVAEALLCEKNLPRFKKHSAVHSAFGEHYAKPKLLDPKFHRWLIEAFESRLRGDYDVDAVLSTADIQLTIQQAREFLEVARQYLSKSR